MSEKPGADRKRTAPRVAGKGIRLELDKGAGKLIDISEQGMRIARHEPAEVGSTLLATLAAGDQRLRVEGKVAWCNAETHPVDGQVYEIGVVFRTSNPRALQRAIFELFMAAG
ncbi:MAG: PilZ domain-containing protein [Thermoanaerobaculia bacterium]